MYTTTIRIAYVYLLVLLLLVVVVLVVLLLLVVVLVYHGLQLRLQLCSHHLQPCRTGCSAQKSVLQHNLSFAALCRVVQVVLCYGTCMYRTNSSTAGTGTAQYWYILAVPVLVVHSSSSVLWYW